MDKPNKLGDKVLALERKYEEADYILMEIVSQLEKEKDNIDEKFLEWVRRRYNNYRLLL